MRGPARDYFDILLVRKKINPSYIPSASPWPFETAQAVFCFLLSIVM
jgi:hypothetical protein